ncbi:MAG TPA: HupE/UreJ family protein [Bryobacteraceae bacterium]|nr:HupE/UreJ family protein [Bryobacteraceae bacterium]
MKRAIWAFALPVFAHSVFAHSLSMSTGELRINGAHASLELRMPMYEVAHVAQPQTAFLSNLRFRSGGEQAALLNSACQEDKLAGNYVCTAEYQFTRAVDVLDVDCWLARITVPNHVHLLHAYKDGNADQAIFDASFETARLRFRPPGPMELQAREMWRGLSSALLLLIAIAVASRRWRDLALMTGALLLAEAIAPYLQLGFRTAFVESAVALTAAYLAVEVLWFPDSRTRWIVAAVGGLFHGLRPVPSLWKIEATEAVLIVILWFLLRRMQRPAAAVLLAVGLGWFAWTIALPK